MQPDPLLFAYLAGALDADGHITVTRSLRKKGKRYTHAPTYYHPRIGYTSTERIVPDLFKATFGGSIHEHQPKNKDYKRVFMWMVGTADVIKVASSLEPYLRQKKAQAQIVQLLCKIIAEQHAEQKLTQKPPYRITPAQLAVREAMWESIAALNQPRNRRVHGVTRP